MSIVFDFLNRCIIQAASWFSDLLYLSGMASFYLAMIFVALVGKFILTPLFGSSRGSDRVKKNRGGRVKKNRGGNENG